MKENASHHQQYMAVVSILWRNTCFKPTFMDRTYNYADIRSLGQLFNLSCHNSYNLQAS